MFKPRAKQRAVLKYRHGWMGVSAVPGSGKTQTLSYLAATLIAEDRIQDDQEVLIVTLVNSSVNNFSKRIAGFVSEYGLFPNLGYRVRTLHGLAHDIVRERPDLVGLDNDFQIIDDRESSQIITSAVDIWIQRNSHILQQWTREQNQNQLNQNLRTEWQKSISSLAGNFIRQAKDMQVDPNQILKLAQECKFSDPFVEMGCEIYQEYQRGLNYRSAVDFDDLIRLALQALRNDPDYLQRLRKRWPYILEDEAQDSSQLQEQILMLLAGDRGNWVRVGDPNQAIYETFTTASPEYLISFLKRPEVISKDLPNSGRSSPNIISLANELIRWTNHNHPVQALTNALTPPFIKPTPAGDPQPNPSNKPNGVFLHDQKISADKELDLVVRSIKKWLPANPDSTVAILVPRNFRGAKVVEELQKNQVPYMEILQTSQSTRDTAALLTAVLRFLENPTATSNLVKIFDHLDRLLWHLSKTEKEATIRLLRSCSHLEEYLFPMPGYDWMQRLNRNLPDFKEKHEPLLITLRQLLAGWLRAAQLPIHQLIITIGQELFTKQTELALTHKLALVLEQFASKYPDWMLPEFAEELNQIASNRRKILGFTDEDTGFDPDQHKGKVIVTTYHKAKGLEWDRVHLLSMNNYDFPSAVEGDQFINEKYFYHKEINLEAETLAKLKALVRKDFSKLFMEDGIATLEARNEYAAERLRLFFVGITRAKQELIITWNSGDSHNARQGNVTPSIAFRALHAFWEQTNAT
ncbi:MAG: ATP-dependent helicase [Chloroflexi bacterium HGW-Chloroflexi-10]|nr:MAG: ATP-dependent helicase [Chloroflexi bacterium HGW-Chloroflexi-10]